MELVKPHSKDDQYEIRDLRSGCGTEDDSPARVLAPCRSVNLQEGVVDDESQHDTKGGPRLPHATEESTNLTRSTFRRESWSRRRLGADCKAQEEASGEKLPLRMDTHLPDARGDGASTRDTDGPLAAEELVQGERGPASDEHTAKVGSTVDESLFPLIGDAIFFLVASESC